MSSLVVSAAQLAIVAAVAIGFSSLGLAPPTASWLPVVMLCLVGCGAIGLAALLERPSMVRLWCGIAIASCVCAAAFGVLYKNASDESVFVWDGDGDRHVAGDELTPESGELQKDPLYNNRTELMNAFGGDALGVWSSDSIDRTSRRLTVLYLLFASSTALTLLSTLEALRLSRLSRAVHVDLGLASTWGALEKIVNDNKKQLDPEVFRRGLAEAERRICQITVAGAGRGTGFLIGPDLVLTNFHVIENVDMTLVRARFDFKVAADGAELSAGRSVRLAPEPVVAESRYSQVDLQPDPKTGDPLPTELDFAILRIAEDIGAQRVDDTPTSSLRGWVRLADDADRGPQMVMVLQHPLAGPMKLSIGMVETLPLNRNRTRMRHGIPTEAGSSGSPLFDHQWRVIALHHSGDPDKVKPTFNEAIPIRLIAEYQGVANALPQRAV